MIWRRLKKSTKEQDRAFQDLLEQEKVSWKDKLAMVFSAYLTILLPCLLILLAFAFVIMLLFGLL